MILRGNKKFLSVVSKKSFHVHKYVIAVQDRAWIFEGLTDTQHPDPKS